MIPQKVQLTEGELEIIESSYQELGYKSKSAYMRAAIREKIRQDRRTLRELKRRRAMKGYGKLLEPAFESLEAEDFEDR